jgi:hypothetical protein
MPSNDISMAKLKRFDCFSMLLKYYFSRRVFGIKLSYQCEDILCFSNNHHRDLRYVYSTISVTLHRTNPCSALPLRFV